LRTRSGMRFVGFMRFSNSRLRGSTLACTWASMPCLLLASSSAHMLPCKGSWFAQKPSQRFRQRHPQAPKMLKLVALRLAPLALGSCLPGPSGTSSGCSLYIGRYIENAPLILDAIFPDSFESEPFSLVEKTAFLEVVQRAPLARSPPMNPLPKASYPTFFGRRHCSSFHLFRS
jgi:hypothetical protein